MKKNRKWRKYESKTSRMIIRTVNNFFEKKIQLFLFIINSSLEIKFTYDTSQTIFDCPVLKN